MDLCYILGICDSQLDYLKCDGRKPSCQECIRCGWTCPGYQIRWKFVDENSTLAKYYANRSYTYETLDSNALNVEEDAAALERIFEHERVVSIKAPNTASKSSSPGVATSLFARLPTQIETDRLPSALIWCLKGSSNGTLIPLDLIGSFFDQVPARLGHNKALDDAVLCLCSVYLSRPDCSAQASQRRYSSYVNALASLRSHLEQRDSQMKPDTLCASIVVQVCEVST